MNMNDRFSWLMSEGRTEYCTAKWKLAAAIVIALAVGLMLGCATLEPPLSLQQDRAACYASYKAPQRAVFSDPRDQLLAQVVESLTNKGNHPCDAMAIAYLTAQGKIIEQQYALGSKALGVAGIIGGIWATGQALEGVMAAGNAGISATASGQGSSVNVTNQTFSSKIGDVGGAADLGGFMTQPAQEPVIVEPFIPPVAP